MSLEGKLYRSKWCFASVDIILRIRNPLAGIPRERLFQQVSDFAKRNGLESETALLQKGALVAQNPRDYDNIPGLTDFERTALDQEITNRWKNPRVM
jgi:hypothetical protein